MTAPVISPLFVRWVKLTVTDKNGTEHTFQCSVTQAGLTSTGGDPVSLNTLCPQGSFSEPTERAWNFVVTGVQDVESAESFQLFLLEHDGEEATFEYYPKTDKQGVPMGRGFTGTVTLAPPDNIGNATSGTFATFTATLPLKGKYSMVDELGNPVANRAAIVAGDVFPADARVTASDAPNAANLIGYGYVVAPPGAAWTTNDKMTIGTYDFNWSGTAWAPGAHALAAKDKS